MGCRPRCLGIGNVHDAVETCAWPPAAHTRYHVEFGALGQTLWAQVGGPKHLETLTHDNKRKTKNIHSTVKGDFVEHCPTLIFLDFGSNTTCYIDLR